MRFFVLICSMALLAVPAATTFSQDMAGSDSGIYFDVGGGLAIVPEIAKAKVGLWYEKDGKEYYLDTATGEKKDGTPTLKEADYDAGFDLGWTVGGALGYRFGDIRAEADVSYTSANYNKLGGIEIKKDNYDTLPSLTILSFMANGWYEIDTGTMFSPFIGLGLGGFHGTISTGKPKGASESTEQTGWGFAVQGGAGVAVEVTDGLSIRLGYRLFVAPLETTYTYESTDLKIDPAGNSVDKAIIGTAAPLMVHRIELGVSYLLPL